MYTITRKQTAFRLRSDLVDRLKLEARSENRSLNNYVESILMRSLYDKPNKTTIEAIREAQSGEELDTLDMSDFKNFVASL